LYCLDRSSDVFKKNLRAWVVVVDLAQAKAIVRNPALEAKEGLAYNNLPKTILDTRVSTLPQNHWVYRPSQLNFGLQQAPELRSGTIRDVLKHQEYKRFCKYHSVTPTQWKNEKYGKQAAGARVIINTNFFFFFHDIMRLPCSTPVGPAISNGAEVMTQSKTDETYRHEKQGHVSMAQVQASSSLVIYRMTDGSSVATTMPVKDFTSWLRTLSSTSKKRVNAVTGHVILKAGKPVDAFGSSHQGWWKASKPRTAIGIQYDGPCPKPLPQNRMCGSKIIVSSFEVRSHASGGLFNEFNPNEPSMNDKDRPASSGATVPELQDVMMFMMMDEAINLDSGGSTSLWTDLATSIGGDFRSQPSDSVSGDRYRFRPSPTLLGFE
jgi:exopolysaccharide biosynthesis protein